MGGRRAKGLGRIRVRPAPLVGQGRGGRGRFSGTGWRGSPPLWGRLRGVVGYGRVQLG